MNEQYIFMNGQDITNYQRTPILWKWTQPTRPAVVRSREPCSGYMVGVGYGGHGACSDQICRGAKHPWGGGAKIAKY